jgi:hypothetical protein
MKCKLLFLLCLISSIALGQLYRDSTHLTNRDSAHSVPELNSVLNPSKDKTDWNTREWNVKLSYTYEKYDVISLGIGRLGNPVFMGSCGSEPNGGDGFSLSMKAYYRPKYTPLYAPTISWEASWWYFFKGIIEVNYVTNFNKGDLYIKPELGINLAIFFYVLYGYNIGVTNNLKNTDFGKSSITIGLNLPLWSLGD